MNGWNLQPSPMKRKENHLNQTSRELCFMFIYRGVTKYGTILFAYVLATICHTIYQVCTGNSFLIWLNNRFISVHVIVYSMCIYICVYIYIRYRNMTYHPQPTQNSTRCIESETRARFSRSPGYTMAARQQRKTRPLDDEAKKCMRVLLKWPHLRHAVCIQCKNLPKKFGRKDNNCATKCEEHGSREVGYMPLSNLRGPSDVWI